MEGTLHFTIGESLGIRLMEIAQEHVLYGNDLKKAFNVFNQSFGGGCPKDLQRELVLGTKVILVDVKSQEMVIVPREKAHDAIYPAKIDFTKFFKREQREFNKHCDHLIASLGILKRRLGTDAMYDIKVDLSSIVKYIYTEDMSDVILDIEHDERINEAKTLIAIVREFALKTLRLKALVKDVKHNYPDIDVHFDPFEITKLNTYVVDIKSLNLSMDDEDTAVTKYLEGIENVDEMLTAGIKPVDILDCYNAGWVSPNGDYYGLNGEIANMLHMQIADGLLEAGIIPKEAEGPDEWLEKNGWVKQHNNWILFSGYMYAKHGLGDEIPITDEQIKTIEKFGQGCCGGMLKLGLEQQQVSAAMFGMMDKMLFKTRYFNL